ncbi:MAG: prepilin-type N-terminal cleavage/methylation domain-containing protein, partial [Desulfobacteraceae bacterium]|nr:prepilin-type N-terminal cleavage/methylation domain-containing protein [Desulfobacteraceae bacterium]
GKRIMIHKSFKYKLSNKRPLAIICGNDGFTLAELMLAMGIMLIVLTAIISLFTSLNRMYTTQGVAAGVQQVTRTAIDIMTRNIRMAGFNPLNINPIGIIQADSDSIRFQYDTNGSGTIATNAVNEANEDLAYLLNENNQVIRQLNGQASSNEALVNNVSDLTFRYLDADDEVTTDLDAIRTVEISLTVEEPAGRDKVLSRTYTTRVICRNLSL